jgi:hypothetical protein
MSLQFWLPNGGKMKRHHFRHFRSSSARKNGPAYKLGQWMPKKIQAKKQLGTEKRDGVKLWSRAVRRPPSRRLGDRSCGVRAHDADYGEVAQPGFLGRLFGRRPKIVKDANLAAAAARLPQGAGIIGQDPNGNGKGTHLEADGMHKLLGF